MKRRFVLEADQVWDVGDIQECTKPSGGGGGGGGGGDSQHNPFDDEQDGDGPGGDPMEIDGQPCAKPVDGEGNEQKSTDKVEEHGKGEDGKEKDLSDIKGEEGGGQPNKKNVSIEDIRKDIQASVNATATHRQANRSRSAHGIGALEGLVLQQMEPVIDYTELLAEIMGEVKSWYDWQRPRTRSLALGYILPSRQEQETPGNISIALDTSGSIGTEMAQLIASEVGNIAESFPGITIDMLLWTDRVYAHGHFEDASGHELKEFVKNNFRWGGTTMSSVADFYAANADAAEHELDPDPKAIVYFTDGEVESQVRLLPEDVLKYYLIVPGGAMDVVSNLPGEAHRIDPE